VDFEFGFTYALRNKHRLHSRILRYSNRKHFTKKKTIFVENVAATRATSSYEA